MQAHLQNLLGSEQVRKDMRGGKASGEMHAHVRTSNILGWLFEKTTFSRYTLGW